MNAPVKAPEVLPIECNTITCVVSSNGKSARVAPAEAAMVAYLLKFYPRPIPRDRMVQALFRGKVTQKDPVDCLRSTMKRARRKIHPLGITINYTPNPVSSDLPGLYALGRHTTCLYPRPMRKP